MSDYREPPKIDAAKIDFSQFHPLDHWPWEPRCRELYGGPRRHVAISWDFRVRPAIEARFGRAFCCWWGHHDPNQVWFRSMEAAYAQDDDAWMTVLTCEWCGRQLSEPQPK